MRPPSSAASAARTCAAGLALLALAAPAAAQPRRDDPTTVSGVEVVAPSAVSAIVVNGRLRCTLPAPEGEKPPRPHVVDTWPRPGGVVPPGLTYLRVTYSERMSPCGFLLGSTLTGGYPDFQDEPALLTRDLKTFYFAVRTEPGKSYGVSFNALLVGPHFRSLVGVGAPAYGLHFQTAATPPLETRGQALAADPGSQGVAEAFDRLLKLWTPRGDDRDDDDADTDDGTPDLPLCGRCQGGVLAGPEDKPAAAPPQPPTPPISDTP